VSSSIADGNPLAVPYEKDQQKIYFRNLKFKYLEQEAKRSFLFSITGDEPQRVMPGENEELGGCRWLQVKSNVCRGREQGQKGKAKACQGRD
jgi:hypothetical protein